MVVLLVSAKGSGGSEAEELLGGLLVRLRDVDHRALLVVLPAAAGRRRGRERGAGLAVGLHAAQLAGAGQLEPLLRTGVRLHLGHGVSLPLLRVVWGAAQASISGSRFSERPRSFFCATAWPALWAVRSSRSAASSAARSAIRVCFSAASSTLASAFLRCGPSTMIMLRPSCLGADSTKPSSVTSSASRCSSRKPSSGRCCSRPRNMMVILTLSPALRNRTT